MQNLKDYVRRVRGMRAAFRRTFLGADGMPHGEAEIVLAELRRFCYGSNPTIKMHGGAVDPYASIAAAARQEVFIRVVTLLNMTDRDLFRLEQQAEKERADG